ncbi:hypothetical protein QEN19_002628 [Hanseniaspora menglaensis]
MSNNSSFNQEMTSFFIKTEKNGISGGYSTNGLLKANIDKKKVKHKSNSSSNINTNKQPRYNSKRTGLYQEDHMLEFKKLPNSKKNISTWVDSIYDNEVCDYDNLDSNKGKNTIDNERRESSGTGNKNRRSSNGHGKKKTSGQYNHHHQHDKLYLSGASFINANYKILTTNVDALVNNTTGVVPFESIERCVTYMNEATKQNCPICLSEDISCGRMVNCGHVFCYPCLLQYIDSTEKKHEEEIIKANKKINNNAIGNMGYVMKRIIHDCPLCGDVMNLKHIVPVSTIYDNSGSSSAKPGKDITMQLMIRPKASILSLPLELGLDPSLINLPLKYDPHSIIDSKFVDKFVLTKSNNIDFLLTDIKHLQEQFQLDQLLYNESDEYVIKAIAEIESYIANLRHEEDQVNYEVEHDDLSNAYLGVETLLKKYNDSNAYFYYQHIDTHANKTFLEGQDVTILKKQYLQFSNFPSALTVQIQHVTNDNQVNNKTMQYLNHLAIGSAYKLIEINLQPQISSDLYHFYKPMLKSRVKLHEKIKRQDNLNKIKGEKQQMAEIMKQFNEDLNMNEYEQGLHIHEPKKLDGDLPTLANLKKTADSLKNLKSIESLKVEDYKIGDRVKVEDIWYTLKRSIWGELHFEKDKKAILTEKNGEILEMFHQQMNIK